MPRTEQESRWRRALQKHGLDFVRRRLDVAHTRGEPEAEVRDVVETPPHPDRQFVEEWHRHEGRRVERRKASWRRAVALLMLAAAAAGVLALAFRWL